MARIGEQNLLFQVFSEILVPSLVYNEVTAGGPGSDLLARASWLRIVDPQSAVLAEQMNTGIAKGESWALALAEERHALLVVDDQQARQIARSRSIAHTGTAGVVARAGMTGVIPVAEVEPLLRRLQADGMRLSDDIIRSVLRRLSPHGAP